MRHQPGDAAVAVKKRVNPQQAMMRGSGRNDGVGLAELAVDLFEAFQEARQRRGADRDVPSHRDIVVAQCARDDLDLFFCGGSSTQNRSSGSAAQKRRWIS